MPFPRPETELGELFDNALNKAADPEAMAAETIVSLVRTLKLETVLSLLAEHCEQLAEAYWDDYRDSGKQDQLTDAAYRISRLSERIGRDDPTA